MRRARQAALDMSVVTNIRHSFAGRWVRQTIHAVYSFQHRDGRPVAYHLAAGVDIQLYPEGEIAEFLAVQRFFERTEMAQTAAYLKPGMKVIDVGANIGVYSILAQQRVGNTGYVWAFEPSSESYRRLLKNLALNKCDRVQPAQTALSARSDTPFVLRSDPGFGDAYRYLAPSQETGGATGETVPAVTLDLYASRNGIAAVDFIKVDVEGCEYMVFQGSQELLASSPNAVVMFESDSGWCARAGCRQQDSFELFRKLGFQLYAWDAKKGKWISDEPSLLGASTVWASRGPQALPLL
jgi:FkbM family methyltransferase